MNGLVKVKPQHLDTTRVRTLTRPLLRSLLLVFLQPFRGGLAGVFGSSSCCRTEASVWGHKQMAGRSPLGFFLVDSRIHSSVYHSKPSWFWSSRKAPDHRSTATVHCWCDLFVKSSVDFHARCKGTHTFQKSSAFVSSVHREFSQKSWGTSRCLLAKLRRALMFLLLSSASVLVVVAQSLSDGGVMNTGLSWGKWGLHFCRCCCGLLDESSLLSGGHFGRKVHHCSLFLPFVDNDSDCVSLESQSFRNGFTTFTRLMGISDLFLICGWVSLDLGMMPSV